MDTAADRVRRDLDTGAPSAADVRALLAERDTLVALIADHSRCPGTTPADGAGCVAGLRGHDGRHRTADGWTW
ncbi:hypothetical protein JOF36_006660 [Pseudonocardia parietis]|uniref:Uncharacterized protein n=1 Tax=Pseudonocardia parietis TaxID=570936 RepID=A0ABS4W440_9PSEU|nr:hypothetical protein [Pseudonocardia parietis]